MTEPVAYWHIPQIENEEIFVSFNPSKTSNFEGIPLYASEDLYPRVKMTKKQYNRLMWDKENTDLLNCLGYFLNSDTHHFGLSSANLRGDLTPEDIARAWLNPDKTIKIVPTMKWFVRSKEPDENGYYRFRSGVKHFGDYYYTKDKNENEKGYPFDYKEEAELWKNPLTVAVQLPVEGE